MLSFQRQGAEGPLLILLHWLGGGAQTWQEVTHDLAARGLQCAALDLPGFGQSADQPSADVAETAQAAIDTIRTLRASAPRTPWLLGGHSMGGKIAMIIARRALDGEPGLEDLSGLVLVSPSPPGPEPVEESRRAEHLETFGKPTNPSARHHAAALWVDHNTGNLPLPPAIRDRAIQGILAIPPASFASWFLQGSKEDWSARIGTLLLPTLLFTGTEETSLGIDVQRTHTLAHLPDTTHVPLQAAKHLAPLERPGELIEHLTQFATRLGLTLATPEAQPGPGTDALLHSDRTSPQTRDVMLNRLQQNQNWNHKPQTFTPAEFRTVRALAERVVPDAGFDLAACIDAQLTANMGDGWRYAALPPDPEAWRRGLLSLDLAANHAHGVPFVSLYPDQQNALLQQVAHDQLDTDCLDAEAYTAREMQAWFQDVRVEFTRFYMGDPRTMDRIGYTGFADDLGFTQIQLGHNVESEA